MCVSVFVTVAVSTGGIDSSRLVFVWQSVGLADVHPIFLRLQVLVIAFIFIIVLGLTVVRGGVAGQCWRRWHRGWSRITEA